MRRGFVVAAIVCSIVLVGTRPAVAHKLAPKGTAEENRLSGVRGTWLSSLERRVTGWGLGVFGEPVHEEITNRIYGCDGSICDGSEALRAPGAVLAGVRWNDDPPFQISSGEGRGTACKVTQTIRFQTQPHCWYQLFEDANQRAAEGAVFDAANRSAMLYRSHFGDLQFLHAMADADDIEPQQTRALILDWARFNWGVMSGEYPVGMKLAEIDNPTVHSRFGRTEWRVQDLYTLGSPGLRPEIRDVAFGSVLHALQDSFARGHVDRESAVPARTCQIADYRIPAPGLITEFHAYNLQDHTLHASADTRGALEEHLQEDPDVVEIGRQLLRAYREGREWREVAPFFECIYALSDSARSSSPGAQFARTDG